MGFKSKNYRNFVDDIINNLSDYNNHFKEISTFTGPSLYFHNQALSLRNGQDIERFLEAIYACLVSWGMHRMGKGGAEMVHFDVFYKSANSVWDLILEAKNFNYENMNENEWKLIEKIYNEITIMDGKTHIVGNSKVLAHLLPNIVAPIDRQYTLNFLHGSTYINKNHQWELMKSITTDFYYQVLDNNNFRIFADELIKQESGNGWNTSRLKIIDNLVIGAIKIKGK